MKVDNKIPCRKNCKGFWYVFQLLAETELSFFWFAEPTYPNIVIANPGIMNAGKHIVPIVYKTAAVVAKPFFFNPYPIHPKINPSVIVII